MSIGTFFQTIWADLTKGFSKVEAEEKQLAAFATLVVNELKTLEATPMVQFLQTGIITLAETEFPVVKPLISGLQLEIPKVIEAITGVVGLAGQPIENQAVALIAYLKNAGGVEAVIGGALGTLNSAILYFLATNSGEVTTPAQTLVTGQAAYVAK